MILVDTSIWIEALRDGSGEIGVEVARLLDADEVGLAAPVRLEILSGARRRDLPRLRRTLSALPYWLPEHATWERLDDWVDAATAGGERFGVMDLLIGAIAADHDAKVWSRDRDFARMERLGLIRLHHLSR